MIQYRIGSFETNSSSANVLIIPKSQCIRIDRKFFFMDDETLVLPEGVKKIGDKAFFGEHLKAIQIPDSVTYIGSDLCNRSSTKIVANDGSYAALYASENGIPLEKDGGDDTSWLDD